MQISSRRRIDRISKMSDRAKGVVWIVAGLFLISYFGRQFLASDTLHEQLGYGVGLAFGLLLVVSFIVALIHDHFVLRASKHDSSTIIPRN
jgi:uncharacterized membrane protein (DUF485 family)